jgi:hypothetical protein
MVRHFVQKVFCDFTISKKVSQDIGAQKNFAHQALSRFRREDLRSDRTNRRVPLVN